MLGIINFDVPKVKKGNPPLQR